MTEGFDSGTTDIGTQTGSTDSGVSTSPVTTSTPGSEQPLNPAWEPALSGVPGEFHKGLTGHFRKWDENYRGLEQKYKDLEGQYEPYKQYTGVDPRALQYGLNIVQQVQQNPMALYQSLQDYVRQQGLLKDAPQTQTPSQDPVGQDNESLEDPRFQSIEQRQAQLDEQQRVLNDYIQQQQYNASVDGYAGDVDQQVTAVVNKYGEKSVDVQDLLQRMFVQVQQKGNFDAEAAFAEQTEVFKRWAERQGSPGRPAPNVLSPNGTVAPMNDIKPEDMNEDQRKAYFKHLLDVANAGG